MESPLNILFQDQHLVVVAKPARLLVASDQSGDQTLLQQVRVWNGERQAPGKKGYCVPIHFLDRPVSGIVVFALSSKAAPRLNALFKQRRLQKTYVAVVEGRPAIDRNRLEHYLVKDKSNNLVRTTNAQDPAAKLSILDYQILATQNSRTWIKVNPETGRSHQIRVQLASMGTPIVGDGKYGSKCSWEGRIALHAFRVQLKHPVGGQSLTIEADLPEYWTQIWPEPWPIAAMRDIDEK